MTCDTSHGASVAPVVLIPHLPGPRSDGGDFQTFAFRKGWDVTTWKWSTLERGFDTNGRSISEMAAFLQHWLFFGLLTAILDDPLPLGDFVEVHAGNQQYTCTSALSRTLDKWRLAVNALDEVEKEAKGDEPEDCIPSSILIRSPFRKRHHLIVCLYC